MSPLPTFQPLSVRLSGTVSINCKVTPPARVGGGLLCVEDVVVDVCCGGFTFTGARMTVGTVPAGEGIALRRSRMELATANERLWVMGNQSEPGGSLHRAAVNTNLAPILRR